MRKVLEGGPIRQPEFFVALQREEALLRRLEARYGRHAVRDDSVPLLFADPRDVREFRPLIREVISGAVGLPLVWKPNLGAFGRGVLFLERNPEGDFVLTITSIPGTPLFTQTEAMKRFFVRAGLSWALREDPDQDLLQIVLPSSRPDLEDLLYWTWAILSTLEGADRGRYDAGMMEAVMPVIRYQGKAYETRHRFTGSLSTGPVTLIKERTQDHRGSFARLGSSAYFSNWTVRRSADELLWPHLYQPLYELLGIPAEAQARFAAHVDGLVQAEFQYLVQRLHVAGIHADVPVHGSFDLMWLPPDPTSGGFPIPALIEGQIGASDLSVRGEELVITTP